jgi:hypothetical protein
VVIWSKTVAVLVNPTLGLAAVLYCQPNLHYASCQPPTCGTEIHKTVDGDIFIGFSTTTVLYLYTVGYQKTFFVYFIYPVLLAESPLI